MNYTTEPLIWIEHPVDGGIHYPISQLTYHTGWDIDQKDGLLLGMVFWEEYKLGGTVVKRSVHVWKARVPEGVSSSQGVLGGGPPTAPDDPLKPMTMFVQ